MTMNLREGQCSTDHDCCSIRLLGTSAPRPFFCAPDKLSMTVLKLKADGSVEEAASGSAAPAEAPAQPTMMVTPDT